MPGKRLSLAEREEIAIGLAGMGTALAGWHLRVAPGTHRRRVGVRHRAAGGADAPQQAGRVARPVLVGAVGSCAAGLVTGHGHPAATRPAPPPGCARCPWWRSAG